MNTVKIMSDGVYLNEEKFFLLSGDFHYFRTVPDGWKRRLELMKDFGLTAVTTYVAWNVHEPKRGQYNFDGIADITRFIKEADEVGLKVILRCSPYMCAEWEMGGLPSWLLADRTTCLRSSDKKFFEPMSEYLKVLAEKVRPFLFTNGGPIILVGLENEYGSFGNDFKYLSDLSKLYEKCGLNVPFISANGVDPFKYINGILNENFNGIDMSANTYGLKQLDILKKIQPDKPLMVGEAWVGNIQFWGKSFEINRDIKENAEFFRQALERDVIINFYMFCGGTNFAFGSGALACNAENKYNSLMTSYDYDAPISEEGVPRAKYFELRDVLDTYLGKPQRPHIAPKHETQSISQVEFEGCAPLFENLDILKEKNVYSYRTLCMEELNQNYGFICYTTYINYTDPRKRVLIIEGLADRATVYLNGEYIGCYLRDAENDEILFTVPEQGAKLTILVENMGRIGYGYKMYDRKGILDCVRYAIYNEDGSQLWNYAAAMGFETITLPFNDISKLKYSSGIGNANNQPAFYRATFNAISGIDTFLDTKGFTRGFVMINGFNIGKFWNVGPQRTLYVPGELLREKNTIELFEVHTDEIPHGISFIDHPILTEMQNDDYSGETFELL